MQPRPQHRSRRGGSTGGVSRTVQRGKPGVSARATQRRTAHSRAVEMLAMNQIGLPSELIAFSNEKRRQLAGLMASGVTSSLRQVVEGWTRLASLVPARGVLPEPEAYRVAHRVFTLHRTRPNEALRVWR